MAKVTLIMVLTVFGACLATPVRNRKRPQDMKRFSGQFEDKFIYGHDDEPDYNDDHTSFSSPYGDDFQPQYDTRTPYNGQEMQEEQQKPAMTEKFIDENQFENVVGESAKANNEVTKKSEEEQKEQNPSLREFTLIISKLLFHLSQME